MGLLRGEGAISGELLEILKMGTLLLEARWVWSLYLRIPKKSVHLLPWVLLAASPGAFS